MRRVTGATIGLASAAALVGLAVPAYANSPASRVVVHITGQPLTCQSNSYKVISGSVQIVTHEGEAASRNSNLTGTITTQHVVTEDPAGNLGNLKDFDFGTCEEPPQVQERERRESSTGAQPIRGQQDVGRQLD